MTTGTGTEAESPFDAAETVVIIRDWQPGQMVKIVLLTPAQAANLPTIPTTALQIAVAPAGE